MDSESPLPAKRLRGSLHANFQLTECVREFKLPRQFPSMVTKFGSEVNNDKRMRPNYHQTGIAVLPKTTTTTKTFPGKIVHNKDMHVPNLMRTIKLKGKDGRDLGEVNVQDLPQNIQGKTICLAKNGIKKQPEIVPVTDKSKGITIGVLTPVNIVNTDRSIVYPLEKKVPSLTCLTKMDTNKVTEMTLEKDSNKVESIEQKKVDTQSRPQVLVFQSGKNWHMVKVPSSSSSTMAVQAGQSKKTVIVGKLPPTLQAGKIGGMQIKNLSAGNSLNGQEISSSVGSKLLSVSHPSMVVKRSNCKTADGTADRGKSKSPASSENSGESSKPKIEVSRIFGSFGSSKSQGQSKSTTENDKNWSKGNESYVPQKNPTLRQDVMVVLPNDSPIESTNGVAEIFNKTAASASSNATWRRKLQTNNKTSEKYSGSRDLVAAKNADKQNAESENRADSSRFSILEKALSTVSDNELRAKALKALAECGIGLERLVPVRAASEQKPVKDSDTQTDVFGLWHPEEFIYVSDNSPGIGRKRPIAERHPLENVAHIVGNSHSQDFTLNGYETPTCSTQSPTNSILSEIVAELVNGNEASMKVENMLTKSRGTPVLADIIEQLEQDFHSYNLYDEDGLLNIHRSVLGNQPRALLRHLKVLKAFGESVDLPTEEGLTSLELAVRYQVSSKIVKYLLESGAQPTSDQSAHDSALIFASKKSLPILTDLIEKVAARKSLDNYDGAGFTALHYCAQNGNESGVKALIKARADLDVRDRRSGRTALFHAVENEHMNIAQLLLDNGAQPNISNYSGHTVVNLIDDNKHYSLAETLNRLAK